MNTTTFADRLMHIFGGDAATEPLSLTQVMARAAIVYLIGIAVVRIGKSRLIARMSAVDVLVGIVLGSLLSRAITGDASISGTAASCAALVAIHWLFTRLACDWHWLGNLVKGHVSLLVKDGKPIEEALLRHHFSARDLEEQLRLKGVNDVADVALAYKERSGDISVIPRKTPPQVVEVAVEPGVHTVRIKLE